MTTTARGDAEIEAVIFDLDGVLADTEAVHLEASRRIVAPAELDLAQYVQFVGGGWDPYVDWIEVTYGIPRGEFDARYTPAIVEALRFGPSPAMTGADALVRAVIRRDLRLAVASMSKREWVEPTLDAIGLRALFPLVVTLDDVLQPKPDPEIYLHTAALLGVAPEACLAVEDSAHGVASAAAAGMRVVQVRQASIPSAPQPGAHAVIESFRDFDLGWLEGRPVGPRI
ncbi:MAG: HAD family hydrolase [Dehalococcoidia bacterium]